MKPKIRTNTFWDEEKKQYSLSFKVSSYKENGTLKFSEKIFPVPSITKNKEETLGILMNGIRDWLAHYELDWEDFNIDDKRVHSILREEIAEKDIPF